MAVAVTGVDITKSPHNGYAVVGELTTSFYQSRPTGSGTVSSTVLHKPALADYVDKYITSYTGIRFYTGDTDA